MRAFGQYIDYAEWFARVKRGEKPPPGGVSTSEMALHTRVLQLEYQDKLDRMLSGTKEPSDG